MRRFAGIAALVVVLLGMLVPTSASAATPAINHLFVIVLENEAYHDTFGPSPGSPYLGKTLPTQGALLNNYYATGHQSLDNYITMISGQPPNVDTQADCQSYNNIFPGTVGADGIVTGQGCVFPVATPTVVNQLDSDGLTWKAYGQDMANSVSSGQAASCRHPNLNSSDGTQTAKAGDQYAARHIPFVYFHSIIDTTACAQDVVDLNQLPADLQTVNGTPNYSFITPDLCADGHDATCADPKAPGGYAGIDAFLRQWVPRITSSPAYQDRGMLLITFDESETGDASSCCNEPAGPNSPNPGGLTAGAGGGRIGAVALSPCITPGTVSNQPYNHYSFLRWTEDNFGLTHLGYAAQAGLQPFGTDVLDRPDCGEQPTLKVKPRRPRAGQRRVFRFQVVSPLTRCTAGVMIRFAGKHRRTKATGRARIRKRFGKRGPRLARTFKPGCDQARKRVRIRAAR